MKEIIEENKKLIIILGALLLISIILFFLITFHKKGNSVYINSYVSKLEAKDINLDENICDIDNVLKYSNIPYFNINNELFSQINEEIMTDFLLRTCYQSGFIDYEASLNDNILSVAINISYDTDDDLAYLEYKTYNINVDNNTIMNNSEILKRFNVSKNDVENVVLSKLKEYYEYEKDKKYLTNQSFNDYLDILDYKAIKTSNMQLYIDDKNHLYIFKDYTLSEGMSIDENFPYITTKFKVK